MISKSSVLVVLILFTIFSPDLKAQDMDCASTIKYRYASNPYVFNEQSRSAICYTGQVYEYEVKLTEGIDYRFSFFASTIFNNNIRFKILNRSTGELLLDLPGEAAGNNTSAILEDYFDPTQKKFIHPYFDILAEENVNYKIIIEVGDLSKNSGLNNTSLLLDSNQKKGCVTVYIQSKVSDSFGF
jgi:hypothetical protein